MIDESQRPIGVFDSGAGGLTILAALRQELPHERYIYFADTAHCPYGTRTEANIAALSVEISRFLIDQGVKIIVVACNTASQAALATLRATFPSTPFVGVVPAVKPAARLTRNGRIAIAATNQAARATYLRQLIDEFAGGIQSFAIGCPELVTLVEDGQFDGPQVQEAVQHCLEPVLSENVDVIVLGCTHFPALRPVIERVAGPRVQIIDSGTAIARRTHYVLDTEEMTAPPTQDLPSAVGAQFIAPASLTDEQLVVCCSGDPAKFSKVASKLLGYPVIARQVDIAISADS